MLLTFRDLLAKTYECVGDRKSHGATVRALRLLSLEALRLQASFYFPLVVLLSECLDSTMNHNMRQPKTQEFAEWVVREKGG